MKSSARLALTILTSAFLLLLVAKPGIAQTCDVNTLDLRGSWGAARFAIEVADDDATRSRGLMFRTELAASQGMLFTYQEPGQPAFWMKNTLIPLDMLFITPEGIVQYVHSMAQPHDLSPISGGQGVLMVLEIRGGLAEMMGISPGSQLRHPALDQTIAVWPCNLAD
ncbi:MAG: DUF192 domain-containing protein [Rhodobacteraceae bacterium]|nr:DUF192 domain-containing protein [Paracoccaceae bacterium]